MDFTPETLSRLRELCELPGGKKALHQVFAEPKSMLNRMRWIESIAGRSADFQGEKVPWFNYGVIRLLKDRVKSTFDVFEYGSGYSTIWWERHARSVHAVEHEQAWTETLRPMLKPSTTLEYRALDYDGRYCRAIEDSDGTYDIVVVDGRDRANCLRKSLGRLKPDGIVVFDNSQRAAYREAIDQARFDLGFKEIQLSGLAPMTFVESFTSILYRAANCFDL